MTRSTSALSSPRSILSAKVTSRPTKPIAVFAPDLLRRQPIAVLLLLCAEGIFLEIFSSVCSQLALPFSAILASPDHSAWVPHAAGLPSTAAAPGLCHCYTGVQSPVLPPCCCVVRASLLRCRHGLVGPAAAPPMTLLLCCATARSTGRRPCCCAVATQLAMASLPLLLLPSTSPASAVAGPAAPSPPSTRPEKTCRINHLYWLCHRRQSLLVPILQSQQRKRDFDSCSLTVRSTWCRRVLA
ncbi:uncharacterized protein LOC104582677 isoform X2 [Brachypodium distachyon]|uniref:uncharacterized protein LOC104582677 isoform X2 n=1 Tax=Brachypodium distachyon TaxID=15368 RepID=UPI00071E2E99|nr:uncharacterized protein LOC104582677 isoform X2 [Brachypodium distachyon]XP_014753687.1 uncharacterized protein LOC104582677 isoform X2 [Brachypodium distachyon]XP_024315866.1 uncharacterized protein LOC104582677 isoform X2 [Brachypodium distachyon]|eukprot:XP_014753686.1 uncharacterized protein LOC104582677 isoform X2 [Brachypodium distachyon]